MRVYNSKVYLINQVNTIGYNNIPTSLHGRAHSNALVLSVHIPAYVHLSFSLNSEDDI